MKALKSHTFVIIVGLTMVLTSVMESPSCAQEAERSQQLERVEVRPPERQRPVEIPPTPSGSGFDEAEITPPPHY